MRGGVRHKREHGMSILAELNLYGRDYEQELRPLIKAFLPDVDFEVNHYEAGEEAMRDIVDRLEKGVDASEKPQAAETKQAESNGADGASASSGILLLAPNPANDYSFCMILMEDWYRIRIYKRGALIGSADADHADPERKAYRNRVAREIYKILERDLGHGLPWGILTGVRPTKLVYEAVTAGQAEESIRETMRNEYLCSEAKIETSITIAKREHEILSGMDYQNGYSIYIGIPFCPTTCAYCSFTSYPLSKFGKLADEYLDALEKEIAYLGTCRPKRRLSTVYIGGGTPTALNEAQLERLLCMVKKYLPMDEVLEYTVEAGRPDSVTEEKMRLLKDYGVSRISINPQSMRQKTLDLIGRRHTAEQIVEAFRLARACGHTNINMDIIIGLTGENPDDVSYTLSEIEKLGPENLTVHTLALKRAARLTTERDSFAGMAATGVTEMLDRTIAFADSHGYKPYYLYRQKNMAENLENVGYAKPGSEGIYNILIMEEKQSILAAGAGAMSKFVFYGEDRIERVENVKSLTDYIARVEEMIDRKREFLANNTL